MGELEIIQNKIHEIRGFRVMLDFDLADLYQIDTSQLKRSVRRNIDRFEGDDFMFELTKEELSRCQFGTLNKSRGSNIKYMPFAFTELGVAMLSSVLNSKTAIDINRGIMRAFVEMRKQLTSTTTLSAELAELRIKLQLLERNDEENMSAINDLSEDMRRDIDNIYNAIAELSIKPTKIDPPRRQIGYKIDHK